MSINNSKCHICGDDNLCEVDNYSTLKRVTSDCQPWKSDGCLLLCEKCGGIQKKIDGKWLNEINKIYDEYSIYELSDGEEQPVFDKKTGVPKTRSSKLIEQFLNIIDLPEKGRLIDVGCGNGALLKSFSFFKPDWKLAGSELNDKYFERILKIHNVQNVYSCPIENINEKFDVVTMLHLLEHITDPVNFLIKSKELLNDDGILLIQLPNCFENPFDLFIVDHCSHFYLDSLEYVVSSAGYEIIFSSSECISKEITIVAKKSEKNVEVKYPQLNLKRILSNRINWLVNLKNNAEKIAENNKFGIFGTSIAGTWLWSELNNKVDFFVDEDKSKIGKKYKNCPIFTTDDIPDGSHVFIALPPVVANAIIKRTNKSNVTFHLPGGFDE